MNRPVQLALDLSVRPALGREDFLVAPINVEAVAWIDRWPDWPAPALALVGPPGCGKTHLVHVWRARSHAALLAADAVAGWAPGDFPHLAPACIVEHADRVEDEAALFHLYNFIAEGGGTMLLTAGTAPARWSIRLADLASRLRAAPVAEIAAPDDAVIEAVLVKLFADRQLRVAPEVVSFLLARMERSFAAARAIVGALDEAAMQTRRGITVSLARDVLGRLADT
jgi:chromosomal replication initiation ATPase DnaA